MEITRPLADAGSAGFEVDGVGKNVWTLVENGYTQLMGRAERNNKKDVYSEERDLARSADDTLFVLSLSKWELFLKHAVSRIHGMLPDIFQLFTKESLPNHHLSISDVQEENKIVYLSPDTI